MTAAHKICAVLLIGGLCLISFRLLSTDYRTGTVNAIRGNDNAGNFTSTEKEHKFGMSMEPGEGTNTVRILALGDSLTEGFYDGGRNFHSYSIMMKKELEEKLPDGKEIYMQQAGVSGAYTSGMIRHLEHYLNPKTGPPFDVVCILGGTNDLSLDDSPEEIFSRIKRLYDMSLEHNPAAILVPITIPQSFFRDSNYVATRSAINQMIKEYWQTSPARERIILVDLERLFPYFDESGTEDTTHWGDHLHMTPAGYDRFGSIMAAAVLPAIAPAAR